MTVIPCEQDPRLRAEIERFAEVLKTQAHTLGSHGLDESELLQFRRYSAAPSRRSAANISATMRGKREFVQHVLNHMEDGGFIAGGTGREPRPATTTTSSSTAAASPSST